MLNKTMYVIIIIWFPFVQSTHFYGGTVTWKPMNNTDTGSTISVMFTQSYQWRRSRAGCGCTTSTILNLSPLIPATSDKLDCVTTPISFCGGYTPISINEYCTDYSTLVDSSSGQISTVTNIAAGSVFCVAFQGSAWIGLQSTSCNTGRRKKRGHGGGGGGGGSTTSGATKSTVATTTVLGCYSTNATWSVGCCVNLTVRAEGFINTPPVASIISRKCKEDW